MLLMGQYISFSEHQKLSSEQCILYKEGFVVQQFGQLLCTICGLRNLQIACQSADWYAFCRFSVCATQSADWATSQISWNIYMHVQCTV